MSEAEKKAPDSEELVVVGSSAGGVEALSILVNTLPADFPAPIVLAQHLDPSRPSILDSILQRRTNLTIELVSRHSELKAGKIYMVPSNHHAVISGGSLEVQRDHVKHPRPSVDLLLTSAAQAYGDHLIAVILTGFGSDGAAGAVEVKNAGGTVITQNPQSARYPSMPLALPPSVVDIVEDIERIGPLLYNLLKGLKPPPTEEKSEVELRNILELVNHQASLDFRHYKTSTIFRRIGRRMTVTHCRTMPDYLSYLKTHPEEVGELVNAFLINVTQFFRDPDAFAYLQREILPQLVARARDGDRVLRFWSAGCATGEEPYSLAMLITDLLGAELSAWSVKIFATDLNEAAIYFARRGLYSENMLKAVPKEYVERFFEWTEQGYRIAKMLRQMVIFGQQDLSRSAPFPHIDLILCRNVLIYFTPELQEYILNHFAFSLTPGSYLFLGKAETVRPLQTFYELVSKQWKVYRSTGGALPAVSRRNVAELSPSHTDKRSDNKSSHMAMKQYHETEAPAPIFETGQLRRFNELLLRFLPIGIVVIGRTYHVLTANTTARRLLGLRDLANEQDFLHAVRGIPYAEVRNAIDTVFRESSTITLREIELGANEGGAGQFITLSITLMQLNASTADLAAISVIDVTEQVQTRRQLESTQAEQTQLMNELSATNRRLKDVNKELMDANEELQVGNEELVLTQEELQASIEEFETTNEELQATNEELETNNEELQATNEELETTNDELRARTQEQQELTSMLERERQHFADMVELAPFYIMVLRGPMLLVEAFNPRYAGLLQGQEVHNRPLEIVFELFGESGMPIVRLAHKVYQRDVTQMTPRIRSLLPRAGGEPEERFFVYHLVPSHDANGKVTGVIIYAVDETEQRAREIEEEQVQAREEMKRLNLLKEDSLSSASSELRNPLEAILANAERLQALRQQLQGEVSQAVDIIVDQAQQLRGLIDEIDDSAHLRNGQFELHNTEHVNIVAFVQRLIEQHNRNPQHPITLEIDQDQLLCTYDEGRMGQVVRNLLNNAIDHGATGTAVTVRIQRRADDVVVAVHNEGAGISPEQQAHIFERFYRLPPDNEHTKAEGLGLQLYIAHEIVTQQGGRMWMESACGEGSIYYFSLPLEKNQ